MKNNKNQPDVDNISIPKKVYEELLQNASRFQLVSSTSNFWLWEVDKNGLYTYSSSTVFDILGYDIEEIVGKSVLDFIIPEEVNKIAAFFQEIVSEQKTIISLVNSNLRKDGNVVILETNGAPIYNMAGDFIGYRGIDRNITRLKDAEIKFSNERLRLKTLIQTIPDLIWLKDNEGVFLTCNPRFEQFFGAIETDIIGKTDYDFVPKDLADFFRKKDNEAKLAEKPSVNLEWVTFASDGHKELLETIKTPMYDSDGKLIGILGISRDITEHKQTEDALYKSRSRLSLAMDVARLGIWEFDFSKQLFTLENRFYSLFGTNIDEQEETMSLEKFSKKFVHPDDISIIASVLEKAIADDNSGSTYKIEIRMLHDCGGIRNVAVRFVVQKDEFNKTTKCSGVVQDITTIKKAELELRELNVSKDKFFSIIAHDLKNPFNTIIGFSEILKEQIQKGDYNEIGYLADSINNSAVQTYGLLENLLEWANSQRNKIIFDPININLKELFVVESGSLFDMAAKKNIELKNLLPDNLFITADKNMIRTILRNLISNAVKFTPKNGRIEISAIIKDNYIEIAVSDNGIGMTEKIRVSLFKIDANLSTPGTENEKGTGLGLILCKEFVEKHGGKIWVESESGKGSVFRFTLPKNI
ncbi:MAG: PAS domain-containing sensor histidine kinase [Candidatus Cloacimonetes bacterium]|nr:PAS domain-containing sensor histidine kinase [Candidatus Cloacimonadota bacterium]